MLALEKVVFKTKRIILVHLRFKGRLN